MIRKMMMATLNNGGGDEPVLLQTVNIKIEAEPGRTILPDWNAYYQNVTAEISNMLNSYGVATGFGMQETAVFHTPIDTEFEPDAPTDDPDFPVEVLSDGCYFAPGRYLEAEITGLDPTKRYIIIAPTYQKNGGDECFTEIVIGGVGYFMGGSYGVLGKATVEVINPAGGVVPYTIRGTNTGEQWPCLTALVIKEYSF